MWSLYRGGLQKVVLNQRFYTKNHLHQVLTVSVFHFHFLFPVSISTVSSCPVLPAPSSSGKNEAGFRVILFCGPHLLLCGSWFGMYICIQSCEIPRVLCSISLVALSMFVALKSTACLISHTWYHLHFFPRVSSTPEPTYSLLFSWCVKTVIVCQNATSQLWKQCRTIKYSWSPLAPTVSLWAPTRYIYAYLIYKNPTCSGSSWNCFYNVPYSFVVLQSWPV